MKQVTLERRALGLAFALLVWTPCVCLGDQGQLLQIPSNALGPTWSPDNSRLAFFSLLDGEYRISIAPVIGTDITHVTSDRAIFPAWSPDGSKIAYESWDYPPRIWVVPADGGEPVLITPDRGEHPTWSPDGSMIAFVSEDDGGESHIWVVAASGGVAAQVTYGPFVDSFPDWSPNGSWIAFSRIEYGIWLVTYDQVATKRATWGTIKSRYGMGP